ncbi:MAG: DUF3108 domain-containing protein [Bdellovibrio sp.]|nr:DUF3108 domain-containing protein [Methylotenera sp.]
MLRLKQLLVFVLLLNISAAYALPKSVQLEYDVARDGKLFARVKESFTQNGKQYHVQSITKGVGIYALLGERNLTSTGAVTNTGLKPSQFELRQGKNDSKTLIADFDWANNTLTMQKKDEKLTEKLQAGTQDLASYAYQFMFSLPQKNENQSDDIEVVLTTGKKLNTYQYKVVARGIKTEVGNTSYKTLQLSNQAEIDKTKTGQEKKQLWLAQDQFYLPVRYEQTDDNGNTYVQTLTKIHVE